MRCIPHGGEDFVCEFEYEINHHKGDDDLYLDAAMNFLS